MNDQKPLCYAPFIGMYVTPYKEIAPCCISRKFNFTDPNEYWNSDELRDFRRQMLEQQWPTGCDICKNKAEAGLPNSANSWDNSYEAAGSPSIDDPKVKYLDLRTSNLCNLKCRMCGPGSSSQWNDEVRDNLEIRRWHHYIEEPIEDYPGYFTTDNVDRFAEYDLIQISLLGGEPTVDPMVFEVMQNLINKGGRLPQIRFTTNGTNLNKRFVDMISKFEDVYITFSVDGTGPTFEYVRTNANWEKVEQNILSLLEKGLVNQLQFNTILSPCNVFTIVDLLAWYKGLYDRGHIFAVSFDNSESFMTSLEAVLPHHMEQQCQLIERFFESAGPDFMRDITGMSDLLPIMRSIRFDEICHGTFRRFNSALDRARNTDIASISPYLIDYR